MKITEQWLTERNACEPGVDWYTAQSANDCNAILNQLTAEERYDWAIWLAIELMTIEQRIQFAIYCAREVLPIYEKYCTDSSPRLAIESAEAYLLNPCKETAHAAADAAADAADAALAAHAALAAAYAARAAADAADAAAWAALAAWAADAAAWAADAKQFQMKIITYARETISK